MRIRDSRYSAAQHDPSRYDNKKQDDHLDRSKSVCSLTPQFGTKVCINVMKDSKATAIPRCSHSDAVRFDARTTLELKTMHPLAVTVDQKRFFYDGGVHSRCY